MLLSPRAEYALRALAVLAIEASDRFVPVQDLAQRAHVPKDFLSKVMRQLVLAGLARAQKGHGGGFQLARAPGRIPVVEILDAIDFTLAADHCAFGWQKCNEVRPCALHGMYGSLKQSFQEWCRQTTLAEVDVRAFDVPRTGRTRRPRR